MEKNKHDGVFAGETRTITRPNPATIKGTPAPHDQPAPTEYGKMPGRGRLA